MMHKFLIWIISLFIVALLTIMAGATLEYLKKKETVISKDYEASPLTLVLDWEIEKPFNFQLFYIHEKEWFSEGESIRKNVTPADKHIELLLPVDKIRGVRLDFGANPGTVIVKNIEIKADHFVNFNSWTDWQFVNIDKHSVLSDGTLEVKSDREDPYMYYNPQMSLSENTEFNVFMREQSKIQEQDLPPEPAAARIVISGKAKKGKLPFDVFLNGAAEPLPSVSNDKTSNERLVIIELTGMEMTLDIKPVVSYAKYKLSLSKPENADKYIKYTSFKQGDLIMIHPKFPSYVSSDTPFESNGSVKSGMIDHYEIKWQKVQSLKKDIE